MPDEAMSSSTALVAPEPPRASAMVQHGIVPRDYNDIWRLAKATCLGGLAPRYDNRPERVAAVMMCGMEIGLKPMSSLRLMYQTPDGQPALMVRGMQAIVQGSGLLAYWSDRVEGEGDARTAIVTCERRGLPRFTRSFSVAEAKKAQLIGKRGDMYGKYLDRMLLSRATSFALNDAFSDLLGGLYDPSELGGPLTDDDGIVMLPPGGEEPAPAPPAPQAPAPPPPPPRPTLGDFWKRSDYNTVRSASATVEDLIDRMLRAIPTAPSLDALDKLFADQTQTLMAAALAGEHWHAVENARRARFAELMGAEEESDGEPVQS